MHQKSCSVTCISETSKYFEKLCKKYSNWLGETLVDSSLKTSLIITVIHHKNFLPISHFNAVDPINRVPYDTQLEFFLAWVFESLYQSDWLNILFKILTRIRDIGGRGHLARSVIPLITVAWQNYFYQNFCPEKVFIEICNKMHFPIWNFKIAPYLST